MVQLPEDHDPSNLVQALDRAINPPEGKVYAGLFYHTHRPTLEDNLAAINKKAGADKNLDLNKIVDGFKQ